jgi:hypothetical protein
LIGINNSDPASGCSGTTYSAGNPTVTALGDIPWLQDVDADSNCLADVWFDSWNVTYRDVIILDGHNVQVGVYNLSTYDLGVAANYNAFRQMLITAAQTP